MDTSPKKDMDNLSEARIEGKFTIDKRVTDKIDQLARSTSQTGKMQALLSAKFFGLKEAKSEIGTLRILHELLLKKAITQEQFEELAGFLEAKPENIKKAAEDEETAQIFKIGEKFFTDKQSVKVLRTSGAIEEDWKIKRVEDGEVVVSNVKGDAKRVPVEIFLAWQTPEPAPNIPKPLEEVQPEESPLKENQQEFTIPENVVYPKQAIEHLRAGIPKAVNLFNRIMEDVQKHNNLETAKKDWQTFAETFNPQFIRDNYAGSIEAGEVAEQFETMIRELKSLIKLKFGETEVFPSSSTDTSPSLKHRDPLLEYHPEGNLDGENKTDKVLLREAISMFKYQAEEVTVADLEAALRLRPGERAVEIKNKFEIYRRIMKNIQETDTLIRDIKNRLEEIQS